jgi:CheY-like chemotaxis protein
MITRLDGHSAYKINSPRVLVVENDPEWRQIHQENLEGWNYQAIVAMGEGEALLRDAREKAQACRCQLALADMHLFMDGFSGDRSGLDLVPELMPTRSIVVSSSGGVQPTRQAIVEKKALNYLQKSERSLIREVLDAAARRFCACRNPARINWGKIVPQTYLRAWFPEEEPIPDDEADDILVQLFPDAGQISIKILREDRANLTSVPRPRSLVLQLQINGLQPVIVKLARKEKIDREVKNYRAHIEGHLVGAYHPHIIDHIILWDVGGVAYQYVGHPENIRLLSDAYRPRNRERLFQCLKEFFAATWSEHYKAKEVCHNKTLFEIYCDVWGDHWYKGLYEHLQSGKVEQVLLSNPKWKVFNAPDPVSWLIQRVQTNRAGSFSNIQLAVTHGDLHADNILIDTKHNIAWVIDYERTGVGHVLQDFVELEADIINRLVGFEAQDYSLFYQLCIFVAQPSKLGEKIKIQTENPRLKFAADIIEHLRQIAQGQSGILSSEEYLWGLLFNTLFRAKLLLDRGDGGDELRRAFMLASILCHRLDEIDQQESLRSRAWPPSSWPKVQWQRHSGGQETTRIGQHLAALKRMLGKFHAFDSEGLLRSVLVVDELAGLRKLTIDAQTPKGRITWTLRQLLKDAPDGRLLILFLHELAECCDEDNEPRRELENFILQFRD